MNAQNSLKSQLISKINESLRSELETVTGKQSLKPRETQIRDLLEQYRTFPEANLLPSQVLQLGSVVLVVEEWWDEPRERWSFIGFGGELPIQHSGRQFQVVAREYFKNQNVGQSFQTSESEGINEMSLNHKIVYAI